MQDSGTQNAKDRPQRRSARKRGARIEQLPWGQPVNLYPRMNIASADEIETLHLNSLRILEEIGIVFNYPEAIAIFRQAGALVSEDGMRVRIGRDIVAQALSTVPEKVTLTPRNVDRKVEIGGNRLTFTTVLGPPNCSDLERGRRPGTLADFSDFVRLGQFFNIIHMIAGSPVEPMDVPVPIRHLESTRAMLELSDKIPYVFCHSRRRVHDVLDMIAISRGMTREDLAASPSTYAIINTNSPLQYDGPMAMGVIELARHNQVPLITPFSLAGATMPIHLAGSISLANAEVLAGLTLGQLVRPGAPIVASAKTVNVDLRTGSPAYGSAEANKCLQIGAQLARRYKVPFRASNFNMSNAPDAQAAYESQGQIWACVTAGTNVVMHAAGWLEGGLCASFEKFVLDVEMLQMIATYLQPVKIDAEHLSFDEVKEVGPSGHYFATASTIANYESAFYSPLISTTKNYGQWKEEGALDATRRAHLLYKRALQEYEQPDLDPARREALDSFVARRIAEGGAPLD